MITVVCPSCSESFMVSDDTIGGQTACPACAKSMMVNAPVEELEAGPVSEGAWEYTILSAHGLMGSVDEKKLNRMGRQGWELVSIFKESPDSHTCFYFKRLLKA